MVICDIPRENKYANLALQLLGMFRTDDPFTGFFAKLYILVNESSEIPWLGESHFLFL